MYSASEIKDKLIGSLIGLSRAAQGNEDLISFYTDKIIISGLSKTGSNSDVNTLEELISQAESEKKRLVPMCYECTASCGRNDSYDMNKLYSSNSEIKTFKFDILNALKNMAENIYINGAVEDFDNKIFYKGLFALGMDEWEKESFEKIIEQIRAESKKLKV